MSHNCYTFTCIIYVGLIRRSWSSITQDLLIVIMSRCRAWCWTLNNYTDDEEGAIQDLTTEDFKYIIYGREKGEEGTPHLQGFIWFNTMKSLAQVKTLLGDRCHLEAAKGRPDQAAEYCRKEGDTYELGEPPVSPKEKGKKEKARWDEAKKAAIEGRLDDVDSDIYLRCYMTLKKIKADHQTMPPALDELNCLWYHGPTGTGKSRDARAENPVHYVKNLNKWWDGYTDQPCVIIEEFAPEHGQFLGSFMKTWCDHYAFSAETKGGTMCIRPPKIIVTSNYRIADCFRPQDLPPLLRRFKEVPFGGGAEFTGTSTSFVIPPEH